MPTTTATEKPLRIHMELRTGDVLAIAGVQIELVYKKGQAARMVICAPPNVAVKKIAAASRPVPSLPT